MADTVQKGSNQTWFNFEPAIAAVVGFCSSIFLNYILNLIT
jgi:hypothetical protein